ncbi:MAG: hypothetical protein LQ344_005437 [Seirophora lacunosa]|nr:MAG: hypothetical protein LQ344_005437 [Seirophora lacunosa]
MARNQLLLPFGVYLSKPENHLSGLVAQSETNVGHAVWTYKELQQAASRLAVGLHGRGVREGSVVAAFLWNSVEWTVLCWAAAGLNACFAALDPRSINRSTELRHALQTLSADVLVVSDQHAVTALENNAPEHSNAVKLKIVCDPINTMTTGADQWQILGDVRDEAPLITDWDAPCDDSSREGAALILFTSGSTSLPKACGHTAANLAAESELYHKHKRIDKTSQMVMQSPNFHIGGFWNFLSAWRAGATLVIPSPRFDAGATLQAIKNEGCTHLPCVPSMLSALFSHELLPSHRPTTLQYLSIGADMVPPHLIERCKVEFGAAVVVWVTWGMTEGAGFFSWIEDEPIPSHNGALAIGRVMPGTNVRICQPGNRTPVEHGQEGELHCSGNQLIRGYVGTTSSDGFYTDASGSWSATGDRAVIDDKGYVYILGRYKDIIKRGGEAVSPGMIESCLDKYGGIRTQVVGIVDPVAGEVPIAIVKRTSTDAEISQIDLHRLVDRELGPSHALAGVFSLEDLRLSDFPLTASGKVRKTELKTLVDQHMQKLDQERVQKQPDSAISQLTAIWTRLLGYAPDKAAPSADSLTVMRFCYEVEKVCGKRIFPSEIYQNPAVEQQALLLGSKDSSPSMTMPPEVRPRDGPPTPHEMISAFGDIPTAERAAGMAKPTLHGLNLDWQTDVEDVYKNNDLVRDLWSSSQRPCSSNIRFAYRVRNIDAIRLQLALQQALTRHATLRTICFSLEDNMPVHAIIRPGQHWFDLCISTEKEADTVDDVQALTRDMNLEFGGPPKPLYRAHIVPIKDTSDCGCVMSVHHSTFDVFSMSAFVQDLEAILSGRTDQLRDRLPFKLYADAYHQHKTGLAAIEEIRYQANRLRGIANFTKCLWPAQKGPEWLIGNDHGWTYRNGEPGKTELRRAFDREEHRPEGVPPHRLDHTYVHLKHLKEEHDVDATSVFKAAVTLFNAEETGQQHAVFCNLDSARRWPFLEPWITDRLPNPLDIAGPTMSCTINVLPISEEEGCVEFLQRIQNDQMEQSAHATAPLSAVMQALGAEEGPMIHDIGRRQVFNWDPMTRARVGTQTSGRQLQLLGRQGWLDLGVFWNFGLVNDETILGYVLYDDAHLRYAEAERALTSKVSFFSELSPQPFSERKC